MGKVKEPQWTVADYERAANEYCQSLPLEHFMEGIGQSTQREIVVESMALVRARRPDVQVFNELLVQYFFKGKLRQVVPDNMVRESKAEPVSSGSYILEKEGVLPLLVFEYVSPSNKRKDYEDNFKKYERELRIPYYVLFYPDKQDLRVHRHNGKGYKLVAPNEHGRYPIPELELELAILDGWVRLWFRGELLPLPGELQQQLNKERARAAKAEEQAAEAEEQAAEAKEQAAEAKEQAAKSKRRASDATRQAQLEKQRADLLEQQKAAAEAEATELRALVERLQGEKRNGGRSAKER